MKLFQAKPKAGSDASSGAAGKSGMDRRHLVLGAGVAGAAAIAAHSLQRAVPLAPAAPVAAAALPEAGDGYQVTPHVLRYYETAKV